MSKDFNNIDKNIEGDDDMSTLAIENKEYRRLDITKLRSKKSSVISSEESLKDIVPIDWSDEVLSGKKKVIITSKK